MPNSPQYQFHGQRRNEEVLLICRQHPCVLTKRLIIGSAIFLLPLFVGIFFPVGTILSVSVIASLLTGILIITSGVREWLNTTFLLTNERAILLEQHGPFDHRFAEVNLDAVRQVSHEVRGVLATLCGFGSVKIYAGGVQDAFVVPNLPEPYEIQQEIQAAAAGEVEE